MTLQFLREVKLTVGDGRQELDLSGLRITFDVTAASTQAPNSARIQVWNASRGTFDALRKEFTRVALSAGYPGNAGVIFTGNIRQTRFVRQTAVDGYVEISAGDGDQAYNSAVVSTTLEAGHTARDRLAALDAAMARFGLLPGNRPDFEALGDKPDPRPWVAHGMARRFYREEAQRFGLNFYILDGRIHLVPFGTPRAGEAVVLDATTGLIGWPEQTEFGIAATCLLNPRIRIGSEVRIANRLITEQQVDQSFRALNLPTGLAGGGQSGQVAQPLVPIRDDGRYSVINCTYRGDTHGGEGSPWFCELGLQGVAEAQTPASVRQGILPGDMQR